MPSPGPIRLGIAIVAAMLALGAAGWALSRRDPAAGEHSKPAAATAASKDAMSDPGQCAECHRGLHPDLVRAHEAGPHAKTASCADCHGTDHDAMFSLDGEVSAAKCGSCHERAYAQFQKSKHGKRMRNGTMDETLVAHARAVGGCGAANGCHDVQRLNADGSIGRCASCHPSHAFTRSEAADPWICKRCHTGPDHPQWEAWANDKHGVLWRKDPVLSPGCADCHMPGGDHDDSLGITPAVVVRAGQPTPTLVPTMTKEAHAAAREKMLAVCMRCHGARLSKATLDAADEARWDGLLLCEEAAGIVRDLDREGLLVPAVKDRAPNPLGQGKLVLGGKQIYDEDMSRAERLFYDMFMFDWPQLWRGAYHTDPNLIRWTWREKLKTDLVEIRAEAARLRAEKAAREKK